MSNKKIYQEVFIDSLGINKTKFNEDLKYQAIDEWDSIGHMTLMSNLEEKFKISLETDDIVNFDSFKKGINILKKYEVEI